jgi:hypothetical protein
MTICRDIKTSQKQFSIICMNANEDLGLSKLEHTVREALDALVIFGVDEAVVRWYCNGKVAYERYFSLPPWGFRKDPLDEMARVILEDVPVLIGEVVYISDAKTPNYSRLAFVRVN